MQKQRSLKAITVILGRKPSDLCALHSTQQATGVTEESVKGAALNTYMTQEQTSNTG